MLPQARQGRERRTLSWYRRRRMLLRSSLLLFVVLLGGLPVLAQASLPDQTWMGGFYDHADYDEVVQFVTSAVGVVGSIPLHRSRPGLLVIAALPPTDERTLRPPEGSSGPSRAPPIV
jgi:hypothetical protein